MSLETGIFKDKQNRGVAEYFDAESSYWNALYDGNDVMAAIYQQRRSIALRSFDELSLSKEAQILEVGCGAGLLTADLARRGYTIEALDRVKSMVDLTRRNALKSGVENRINTHIGDVCQMPFRDGTFRCLIALGGLKGRMKSALEKFRLRKPSREPDVHRYTLKEFNRLLKSVGLVGIKHHMIGFGPFSFCRYGLLSDTMGIKLHHLLQRYSNRGSLVLRSTGSQFLVVATKS